MLCYDYHGFPRHSTIYNYFDVSKPLEGTIHEQLQIVALITLLKISQNIMSARKSGGGMDE